MEPPQLHEWDVLEHGDLGSWLDGLRREGWHRVEEVCGVKTPQGTIGYLFERLAPAVEWGA